MINRIPVSFPVFQKQKPIVWKLKKCRKFAKSCKATHDTRGRRRRLVASCSAQTLRLLNVRHQTNRSAMGEAYVVIVYLLSSSSRWPFSPSHAHLPAEISVTFMQPRVLYSACVVYFCLCISCWHAPRFIWFSLQPLLVLFSIIFSLRSMFRKGTLIYFTCFLFVFCS